jgi:hypothetical protein
VDFLLSLCFTISLSLALCFSLLSLIFSPHLFQNRLLSFAIHHVFAAVVMICRLLVSLLPLLLCMSLLSLVPPSLTNNCVICYLACIEENMEKRENENFLLPVSLGFVRSTAMILLFTLTLSMKILPLR